MFNQTASKNIEDAEASILLVEDHMLAAIAVTAVLKPLGCHIDLAENGMKAVEMAYEVQYDLILMDIGLPDISGIEATRQIRAFHDRKKSQVPIVALTGHANNPEMRQEAVDAGMQRVLSKPAQPKTLKAVLQRYVFGVEVVEAGVGKSEVEDDVVKSIAAIDWEACVHMYNGDHKFARKMLSVMDNDLNKVKVVLAQAYKNHDREALRAELHRSRGGVSYLKLPELEHALECFHNALKAAPRSSDLIAKTYTELQHAIDNFKTVWESEYK
ncbi:MAG: response regulator [Coxiellaceae bacterium]|nr:response regulator [Coxiellaceae bacterium]